MTVEFDRSSVCMGDDCMPHIEKRELADTELASDLLYCLSKYVPSMYNVVWTVYSPNVTDKIIGYIITDNQGKSEVELNIRNATLNELFTINLDNITVFCKYYHQGSFSWIEGKTGKYIEKHSECSTLLEKVKSECKVNKCSM